MFTDLVFFATEVSSFKKGITDFLNGTVTLMPSILPPFISAIIFGSVKDNNTLFNLSVFKDPSDKAFAKKLFHYTITNNGFIWTYPGKQLTPKSVIVCHTKEETGKVISTNAYGICSDYVGYYK